MFKQDEAYIGEDLKNGRLIWFDKAYKTAWCGFKRWFYYLFLNGNDEFRWYIKELRKCPKDRGERKGTVQKLGVKENKCPLRQQPSAISFNPLWLLSTTPKRREIPKNSYQNLTNLQIKIESWVLKSWLLSTSKSRNLAFGQEAAVLASYVSFGRYESSASRSMV